MLDSSLIRCKECGKHPDDIEEYQAYEDHNCISAVEFVQTGEGTYNSGTGFFWCTSCYINIGMPLGTA